VPRTWIQRRPRTRIPGAARGGYQPAKIQKTALLVLCLSSALQAADYVTDSPKPGDGVFTILKRYQLMPSSSYIEKFNELNAGRLGEDGGLQIGRDYRLPIERHRFDGITIRSTLETDDYALAKRIQTYNETVHRLGLKPSPYTVDGDLWVPWFLHPDRAADNSGRTGDDRGRPSADAEPDDTGDGIIGRFPIFGPQYLDVVRRDSRLRDCVFYLVSGHGGPDPGAVGVREGHRLYEDEYAYDITLRLARRLLEHDATVYMVVRDTLDGIRDAAYLTGDRDEVYYGGEPISRNTIRRLNQRVEIINRLYARYKPVAKKQFALSLHVDSRSNAERIDIFYYYHKSSRQGRHLARTLYQTIKRKYALAQPGRGYRGVIAVRDLHLLRETWAPTVVIELGNIRNPRDQDRFVQVNNRQAVANWLCEGLIAAAR